MRFARVFATAAGLAAFLIGCSGPGPLAPAVDQAPLFSLDAEVQPAADDVETEREKKKKFPPICSSPQLAELPLEAQQAISIHVCGLREVPKK